MNLEAINWQMYGVALAGLVFIYNMYRNIRNDLKDRFDKIDKRFELVDKRFDGIEKDIASSDEAIIDLSRNIGSDMSEIKERLSFLESAALYTMPIEPAELNPRSQAAREMWKRRKSRAITNKQK